MITLLWPAVKRTDMRSATIHNETHQIYFRTTSFYIPGFTYMYSKFYAASFYFLTVSITCNSTLKLRFSQSLASILDVFLIIGAAFVKVMEKPTNLPKTSRIIFITGPDQWILPCGVLLYGSRLPTTSKRFQAGPSKYRH